MGAPGHNGHALAPSQSVVPGLAEDQDNESLSGLRQPPHDRPGGSLVPSILAAGAGTGRVPSSGSCFMVSGGWRTRLTDCRCPCARPLQGATGWQSLLPGNAASGGGGGVSRRAEESAEVIVVRGWLQLAP